MTIEKLGSMGGVFALLTFWHFLADWTFQSHAEAMAKSKDRNVRAWHCTKYALAFAPALWAWTRLTVQGMALALGILLLSHYIIDSYVPVMLWAKHLRKAPQFAGVGTPHLTVGWRDKVVEPPRYANDTEAFVALAQTPLGLVLMITMDQFFHIACLLPIAYMIVS